MQQLWNKRYLPEEWVYLRWSLALIWAMTFFGHLLFLYDSVPLSVGVCEWMPCDIIVSMGGKVICLLIALLALFFYVRNKHMVIVCFSIGVLSMIWFTVEESNGILARGGMFTSLFFAQGIAFLVSAKSGEQRSVRAIRYSVQIVVAAYWLASISKLDTSGLQWVLDGRFIPLQVMKSFSTHYFTFGNESFMIQGKENVAELMSNSLTIQSVLFFSLVLEFMSPLAIIGRRWALIVGLLLVSMHAGIAIIMGIVIWSIFVPMIIVLVNPVYLVTKTFVRIYHRLKNAKASRTL